jgi:hypothetical protein
MMGPIPLVAHVVNQQAPAAWQWHRPSEGVRLVPKLVGLARLAPLLVATTYFIRSCFVFFLLCFFYRVFLHFVTTSTGTTSVARITRGVQKHEKKSIGAHLKKMWPFFTSFFCLRFWTSRNKGRRGSSTTR